MVLNLILNNDGKSSVLGPVVRFCNPHTSFEKLDNVSSLDRIPSPISRTGHA